MYACESILLTRLKMWFKINDSLKETPITTKGSSFISKLSTVFGLILQGGLSFKRKRVNSVALPTWHKVGRWNRGIYLSDGGRIREGLIMDDQKS